MSQSSYTPESKAQVVREAREPGNASLVARRHQLNPEMVRRWTREATNAAHPDPDALSLADENGRLKKRVFGFSCGPRRDKVSCQIIPECGTTGYLRQQRK
ncbi:MAG: transposase [Firmicutes bacterium]|nr:transposase [Bacillota bacterium]